MTVFFDPNDPNLQQKLEALRPTPGYCILGYRRLNSDEGWTPTPVGTKNP